MRTKRVLESSLWHTMQAVAKRGLGSLRCPSLEETGNYWVEGTGEKELKE